MKLELKDKELQKKLDGITDGCLTESLQGLQKLPPFDGVIGVGFGQYVEGHRRHLIYLRHEEIEDVHGYDPNTWNRFPWVTPPEDVQMRCITRTGMGFMLRYINGDWVDNRNDIYDEHGIEGAVDRFRPWED